MHVHLNYLKFDIHNVIYMMHELIISHYIKKILNDVRIKV